MKRSILTVDDISIFDVFLDDDDLEETADIVDAAPPVDLSIWLAKRELRDVITKFDSVAFKIICSSDRDSSRIDPRFDDVSGALVHVQTSLPCIRSAWKKDSSDKQL